MKNSTIRLSVILLSMVMVSCAPLTNEDVGTISGGVIGGLVGSQFGGGSGKVAAAAVGVLAGAYIGGNIGRTMDRQDRIEMQHALEKSPTGKAVSWHNPDTGNRYVVTPTKTYYRQDSRGRQACREYTTTAIIGGKKEQIYGKACRTSDGSWKVVN